VHYFEIFNKILKFALVLHYFALFYTICISVIIIIILYEKLPKRDRERRKREREREREEGRRRDGQKVSCHMALLRGRGKKQRLIFVTPHYITPQTERTVPLSAPTMSHFSHKSLVDHDRQELSAAP